VADRAYVCLLLWERLKPRDMQLIVPHLSVRKNRCRDRRALHGKSAADYRMNQCVAAQLPPPYHPPPQQDRVLPVLSVRREHVAHALPVLKPHLRTAHITIGARLNVVLVARDVE
jgi:hypothetical protein